MIATVGTWSAAEYYASLLHAGREQVDRFTGERAGVLEVEERYRQFLGRLGWR